MAVTKTKACAPLRILVMHPDGRRQPLRQTSLAVLEDVLQTIAADGEDAVMEWFEPVNRPPVDDAEIDRQDRTLTLHLFATEAVID